jgi:hypothetical protein
MKKMNQEKGPAYVDFSRETMYPVVRAVLAATRFSGHIYNLERVDHPVTSDALCAEAVRVLKAAGYTDRVYNCITPRMTLQREGFPWEYAEVEVDLRKFAHGDDACQHEYIRLYWEEGGGAMDSGTPHTYIMCMRCAKSPVLPSIGTRRKPGAGLTVERVPAPPSLWRRVLQFLNPCDKT